MIPLFPASQKNARIIPVINHRIPHDFQSLLPLTALNVFLLIARRADLDDPEPVERFHVRPLRRNVHPPKVIGMAVPNHPRREIVHPIRIRLPQPRPFVAGALRVTTQIDELVVDINSARSRSAPELYFAESAGRPHHVHDVVIDAQHRVNVVKIRIVRAPQPHRKMPDARKIVFSPFTKSTVSPSNFARTRPPASTTTPDSVIDA